MYFDRRPILCWAAAVAGALALRPTNTAPVNATLARRGLYTTFPWHPQPDQLEAQPDLLARPNAGQVQRERRQQAEIRALTAHWRRDVLRHRRRLSDQRHLEAVLRQPHDLPETHRLHVHLDLMRARRKHAQRLMDHTVTRLNWLGPTTVGEQTHLRFRPLRRRSLPPPASDGPDAAADVGRLQRRMPPATSVQAMIRNFRRQLKLARVALGAYHKLKGHTFRAGKGAAAGGEKHAEKKEEEKGKDGGDGHDEGHGHGHSGNIECDTALEHALMEAEKVQEQALKLRVLGEHVAESDVERWLEKWRKVHGYD